MKKSTKEIDQQYRLELLYDAIHQEERYGSDNLSEYFDTARWIVSQKPFSSPRIDAYDTFMSIARYMVKYEKMIRLIKYIKSINPDIISEPNNDNYYEKYFSYFLKEGKKFLKKLRPYVLEYTSKWTEERKQMDLNREVGPYFNGWYLKPTNANEKIN